jgi:hypothetical protein
MSFSRRSFVQAAAIASLNLCARRAKTQEKKLAVKYPIPDLDSSYVFLCPELVEIKSPGPLVRPDRTALCSWSRRPYLDVNLEDARFYSVPYFQRFRMKKWDMYHIETPEHYLSFIISWIGYGAFCSAYVYERGSRRGSEGTSIKSSQPETPLMRDSTQGISEFKDGKVRASFEVRGERRKIKLDWPGFAQSGLFADIDLVLPAADEIICATHLTSPRRMHYDVKINCMPASGMLGLAGKKFKLDPQNSFGMLDFGRGYFPPKLFWYWAVASGVDRRGKRYGFNLGHGNSPQQTNENAVFYDGRVHKINEVAVCVPQDDLMKDWTVRSNDRRVDLIFSPQSVRYSNLKIGSLHSIGNPALGLFNGSLVLDNGETIEVKDLFGLCEWFDQKW